MTDRTESDQTADSDGLAPARLKARRGVALVAAIFSIVVLAIIISGTVFTTTQEYRGARNSLIEQRAFAVAEFGVNSEISNWDRSRNLPGGMATGEIDSGLIYVASGDTAHVKVTRLTDNTFWVMSEGWANIGNSSLESRRQVNTMVRIAYPSISPKGALTAAGDIKISGSASIDGHNTDPPGWGQCAAIPGVDMPGLIAAPTSAVDSGGASNVLGTPPVVRDPAAADSNTYVRYGSESWLTLTANADIKLAGGLYSADMAPVGTATTCNLSVTTNWGEPLRPGIAGCYGYFPIVYSSSSLKLSGNGRGQGILLVNGDLEITGKLEWYGIVVIRDDFKKSTGTAMITGAVYSANAVLADPSLLIGNQDVTYSKCAVESALRGSAILTRVIERAWSQIY
jgi:hypothetical protein